MLQKHTLLEKNSILLTLFIIIAVSIGGLIEIVPLFRVETTIEPVKGVRPYTPLELIGQNLYVREGCSACHSQQVRVLRDEVERYGHYSLAAESMYDYPFLWGSKRTGPDLARLGGKYSDEWHVQHLIEPRDMVPESIMPSYGFLMHSSADLDGVGEHMRVLQVIGVPYTTAMIENAKRDATAQARPQSDDHEGLLARYGEKVAVRDFDTQADLITEMDALVAYLQVLGTMVDFRDFDPDLAMQGNGQ